MISRSLGESYNDCLYNLENVLKRFEEINLVLNLEKRHFMAQKCIAVRNRISRKEIEVYKVKTRGN